MSTGRAALAILAILAWAAKAQASECGETYGAPRFAPLTVGRELPRNTHPMIEESASGAAPSSFAFELLAPGGAKIAFGAQVITTDSARLHELVPRDLLGSDTEYTLAIVADGKRTEHTFTTGRAIDDLPPELSATTALFELGRLKCAISFHRLTLARAVDDATPEHAIHYLIWAADEEERIDTARAPDALVRATPSPQPLVTLLGLDTPTRIAVQAVDAAGHRGAIRELTVTDERGAGRTWSQRRQLFDLRARRLVREHPLSLALVGLTLLGLIGLFVRARPVA